MGRGRAAQRARAALSSATCRHGWVASDQIRSVLDLFAYEHEGEHALVFGGGVFRSRGSTAPA